MTIAILPCNTSSVMAQSEVEAQLEKSVWSRYQGHGGDYNKNYYRFVKALAPNTLDGYVTPVDFTHSKNKGWQLYLTNYLISPASIRLIIDDEIITTDINQWSGIGYLNKVHLPIEESLINKFMEAQSITIEEIYSDYDVKVFVPVAGLKEALLWAQDLNRK
jgi:hypothetical protein